MRSLPALLLLPLLAGCLGSEGEARDSETDDMTEAPLTEVPQPEPGLFMASPGRMEKVTHIPGLEVLPEAGRTKYNWDILATIEDNAHQILLMQVFSNSSLTVRLDADVAYDDLAFPGSERRTPMSACFSASALNVTAGGVGDYYLSRALDLEVPVPTDGRPNGPGGGHGRAAAGGFINPDFRFSEFDVYSGPLVEDGWMMFANGISQVPAASAQQDGNKWWTNWTIDVPHRVISIPLAPLYCYFGLGEAQGADVFTEVPYPYMEGGVLEVETRYGSSAMLMNNAGDPISMAVTADNRAVVTFMGQQCRADADTMVVQSSFEPSTLRVDVERWAGYPRFLFSGLGPWQAMWAVTGEEPACTPP